LARADRGEITFVFDLRIVDDPTQPEPGADQGADGESTLMGERPVRNFYPFPT